MWSFRRTHSEWWAAQNTDQQSYLFFLSRAEKLRRLINMLPNFLGLVDAAAAEVWRPKVFALQVSQGPIELAVSDLVTALEEVGQSGEKCVLLESVQRVGGVKDGRLLPFR